MTNDGVKLQDLLHNDWKSILKSSIESDNFQNLAKKVADAYSKETVYPSKEDLFEAFHLCSFQDTRVVILGQDPYHGPGQAHGLSFSVPNACPFPPSLKNIFKELYADLGLMRVSGDLSDWAVQGVLLLNTSLTVRAGEAGSHAKLGWLEFTKTVLKSLNSHEKPIVFLLWGNHAQQFSSLISDPKHLLLTSAHPSPLAANRGGWFGSRHFSRTNEFFVSHGLKPIIWA